MAQKKKDYVVVETQEKEVFETGAKRNSQEGKGRYDLIPTEGLLRLAKHYETGANMHGERNWENGMYFTRLLNSAIRHTQQYLAGEVEEDHLAAACWNLFAIMHFERYGAPALDDRPYYKENLTLDE